MHLSHLILFIQVALLDMLWSFAHASISMKSIALSYSDIDFLDLSSAKLWYAAPTV